MQIKYKKEILDYIKKYKLNDVIGNNDYVKQNYELLDTVSQKYYKLSGLVRPEWDDLIFLHKYVLKHKIVNILEFGIGYSTLVFADALRKNKNKYYDFVKNNLRKTNLFQVYSVDDQQNIINHNIRKKEFFKLKNFIKVKYSPTYITEINNRICSLYKNIPNFVPDLIYLDAPSLYNTSGKINNFSFEGYDKVPISGNILKIEYFLMPGCTIIIDGRLTNGRFLYNNFQRKWRYKEDLKNDRCILVLSEKTIGKYNSRQIMFRKKFNIL